MSLKINIQQSIMICFLTIIIVFVCSTFYAVYILKKNEATVDKMIAIDEPSSKVVNEFHFLLIKSSSLVSDFVYQGAKEADKDTLKRLIYVSYPSLKKEIKKLRLRWTNQSAISLTDSIMYGFEGQIKNYNKVLMSSINDNEEENNIALENAQALLSIDLLPNHKILDKQLAKLYQYTLAQKNKNLNEMNTFNDYFREKIVSLSFLIIAIIVFIGLVYNGYTHTKITQPLLKIGKTIDEISKGEINEEEVEVDANNGIMGTLSTSVKNLKVGLKQAINFSNEIGQAKFDTDFKILSKKDLLGISLLQMRKNLLAFNEAEKQRSWSAEGMTKFAEILRLHRQNLKTLSSKIIIELVNYTDANQGGFFLINNDNEANQFIELKACYAYQREKLIKKEIPLDEGIIGQCVSERETIFITDIPSTYIEITSGLGYSYPKCILVVPLKTTEEVYGVIELASFKIFQDFEIAFIEKIAETIATTVAEVQMSAKTQDLLEQMQMQTEQLKAQEEEMRQNMEELMATQEQMMRQTT
jgi:putative methionine-R-sulfoxide reductase with GAF domain